jgi:regulator of protease activity HflC (stomatin/prohibitin superfamily)
MSLVIILAIALLPLLAAVSILRRSSVVVPEDQAAVVVDRHEFIRRTLPAGVHWLRPGLERVAFTFETQVKLGRATASAVSTADGVPLQIAWSGTYYRDPSLITDKVSQRLRALPGAERSLERQVDIALRRLIGDYTLVELFKPAIRDRIERQLSGTVANRLKPAGVVVNEIDLQAMDLPLELATALNQARAIEALDAVIRHSDAATREVVSGAHKLEELLSWSEYLPPYGRYALAAR